VPMRHIAEGVYPVSGDFVSSGLHARFTAHGRPAAALVLSFSA